LDDVEFLGIELIRASLTTHQSDPLPLRSGGRLSFTLGIGLGASLKKDIWVDSRCIGESAQDVFFYTEVKGNAEHKLSTESEFSPNDLQLRTENGNRQALLHQAVSKAGCVRGRAGLEVVPETEGNAAVANLDLAKDGVFRKYTVLVF
jgi:hypothetical protein